MQRSTPLARHIERLLFLLLGAALVWAPLPFGSNRTWAVALLALLLSLMLATWLGLRVLDQVSLSRRVWHRGKWPVALLLFVTFWVFLQTIPLPAAIVEMLSPRTAALYGDLDRFPLSLDPAATQVYFLNSLACFAAFFLVLALVNSESRARVFLWLLVCSGVFQAVYGSLMVLTGLEWGFLVEKYVGKGNATGTFVNRNHLAGYLVMSLSLGTGLLISRLSVRSYTSWQDFARRSLRMLMSPKVFLRLFLALMVIGLVMTKSRMGNTAFFVALGVAGVVAVFVGRKFSPKLAILLLSLLIVDVWIVGEWFGLDKVVERLEQTAPAEEVRLRVSSDTTRIVWDFALTGSGGGSFETVFTRYQGLDYRGRYEHAHNDYLEVASDLGVPALSLLALFCLLAGFRAIRMQKPDHTSLQRGTGFALIMVLTWLALHTSVDFNLQIPANSVTLSAILGLAFAKLLPGDATNGRS